MKLHILSDLHTEFADFDPPTVESDVVALAGDIGSGLRGTEWAKDKFDRKAIIYVPGNHEYYKQDIALESDLRAASTRNLKVLNNDLVEVDGVRFLGCTLWTDFRLNGKSEAWFARRHAKAGMSDFRLIRNGERAFTPEDSVRLHDASRAWLEQTLATPFDGPTVVVTHHLPSEESVSPRYANDPLNPAFASRLDDLMEKFSPELWIHGHTHIACDYQLFNTRVVCNPRGYPGESKVGGFDPEFLVGV